jgi:hypothetical protein
LLSEGRAVVEVIGGQVGENEWGWESLALRGRYPAYVLGIASLLKMWGGERRGSAGGGVDTEVEGVGCHVGKNEWEVGDFIPNGRYRAHALDITGPSKPSHEKCRGGGGGVQVVACILKLRVRLVMNTRTSGAGHLARKTKN